MATEPLEPEPAEDALSLPETIGSAELEALNLALGALFGDLRFARGLPAGETHGRLGAVVAFSAAWRVSSRGSSRC
jgi:hypothetical protein